MDNTTCTYSDEEQKPLTMDIIRRAIRLLKEYKDPYQQFAEANGFDLSTDVLVIPESLMYKHKLRARDNIIFSAHIENKILFIRGIGQKCTPSTPHFDYSVLF
jgi:hypothetical protein